MKTRLSLPLLALVLMGLLASCSKSDDLTRFMPKSTVMAITLDAEDLIENTGSRVTDHGIELSSKLSGVLNSLGTGNIEDVLKMASTIDLEHMAVFATMGSAAQTEPLSFFLARLKDSGDFAEALEKEGFDVKKADDGFTTFGGGGAEMGCMKDDVVWLYQYPQDAGYKKVAAIIKEAEKEPIAEWKTELLDEDNTFNMVIDPTAISPAVRQMIMAQVAPSLAGNVKTMLQNTYALHADLKGLSLQGKLRAYDAQGKNIDFDKTGAPSLLQPIDTSLLKYFGKNDIFIAAAGLKGDADWAQGLANFNQMLANMYGMEQADPFTSALSSLLSSIDGTIMIGGGVNADNLLQLANYQNDFSAIDLAAAVQLKPGLADSVFEVADATFGALKAPGTSIETIADGRVITLPQGKIYLTRQANTLFMGLHQANDGGNCPVTASAMADFCSAFVIDIPQGSPAARCFGLPYGVKASMGSTPKEATFSLELVGAKSKYLLEEIINTVV